MVTGCNSCYQEILGVSYIVRCYLCQDGLYLLANSTGVINSGYDGSLLYPDTFTFCVPDCKRAHYAFINNPATGNCTNCGENCQSCNPRTGCEICGIEAQKVGWVNATVGATDLLVKPNDVQFSQCMKCPNNQWCMKCDRQNTSKCTTCADQFKKTITQSSSNGTQISTQVCEPSTNSLYDPNCLQYSGTKGIGSCDICIDSFYKNPYNYCSQCRQYGCFSCTGPYDCILCNQGFSPAIDLSTSLPTCYDCNQRSSQDISRFGPNYYQDCAYCNVNETSGIMSECVACQSGYVMRNATSKKSECVSSCPAGYFGQNTYGPRGIKLSSDCVKCSDYCEECAGTGLNMCTRCPKGQYLEFVSSSVSYGICRMKNVQTASYQLWITPTLDLISANQSDYISGLNERVFYDIEDTMKKAYELCANVTQRCNVTIYLLNGEHYWYRKNYRTFYLPVKNERDSSVMLTNLQPWYCDDALARNRTLLSDSWLDQRCLLNRSAQIVVNNRKRDSFSFLVGAGLTISNVIFDSLGSLILPHYPDSECLNNRKKCCNITKDTFGSVLNAGASKDCFRHEKQLTEDCQITTSDWSFIKFDVGSKTLLSSSKSPPTLTLINSTFQNFLFQFNSLIQLNPFGGYIVIQNSTFERISSCGAIIKNFQPTIPPLNVTNNFTQLYGIDLENTADVFNYRNNKLSIDMQTESQINSKLQGMQNPFNCDMQQCFSINITRSSFRESSFLLRPISYPATTNNPDLQYQGKILNVRGFGGNITISDSYFGQNQLAYVGCSAFQNVENLVSEQSGRLQIKNLLSIRNHSNGVMLLNNTFEQNSVVKGLVYIQVTPRVDSQSLGFRSQIIIANNTFDTNMAYLDSSAIFIRNYIPSANSPCRGVSVQNNYFTNNFGCTKYGGSVLAMTCINQGSIQTIDAFDRMKSGFVNNYTSQAQAIQDKSQRQVITLDWKRNLTVNLEKMELRGNKYYRNYGGYSQGLVEFRGVPRVEVFGENFTQNGENAIEWIIRMGLSKFRFLDNPQNLTTTLYNLTYAQLFHNQTQFSIAPIQPIIDIKYSMKAMIRIEHSSNITIENSSFFGNFLFETEFNRRQRAAVIFISSFNGSFQLNNTQIGNHSGMFEKSMRDIFFSSLTAVTSNTNTTNSTTKVNTTSLANNQSNNTSNASSAVNISVPVTGLTSFNQIFVSNTDNGIGQLNSLIAIDETNSIVKNINLENLEIRNITFRQLQTASDSFQTMIFSMNNSYATSGGIESLSPLNITIKNLRVFDIGCIDCNEKLAFFAIQSVEKLNMTGFFFRNISKHILYSNSPFLPSMWTESFQLIRIGLYERVLGTSMKNLSLSKNITLLRYSSFENIYEVGAIVQLIANSPFNITLTNISVTNVSSSRNAIGFSVFTIKQGYSSQVNISENKFTNLNSSNSDGLILKLNGLNLTENNFLTQIQFQKNTLKNIQASSQLFASKAFKSRGLGIFVNQATQNLKVFVTNNTIECSSLSTSNFKSSELLTMATNSSFDANTGDDYGSIFYLRSLNTQVVSRLNDFRNCSQSSFGGAYRIESVRASEFNETLSNYSMMFATAGGIVYCKNCYKLNFQPQNLSKLASFRGGAIALQSDINCNYRGTQEVKMSNITLDDAISLNDGGGLLYTRSDCYLELTISGLKANNSRALYQVNQPGAFKVDISLMDLEGGGLIKCTAASLRVNISNSNFTNMRSYLGVGGIFNFHSKDTDIQLLNNTILNVTSRLQGAILYQASPIMIVNMTNNTVRCRDYVNAQQLTQKYYVQQLEAMSSQATYQPIHANMTNVNQKSSFYSNFNLVQNCFIDSQDSNGLTATGGVYFVSNNLQIRDTGSTYENNSALSGSVYYCEGCQIVSINNTYKNNVCLKGCVVYYKPDNKSLQLSPTAVLIKNTINFSNAKMVNNYARQSASGFYIDSAPPTTTTSTGIGRSLQSSNPASVQRKLQLSIDVALFSNNSADFGKGGIFYINSHMIDVNISRSSFVGNRMNFRNYSAQDAAIFYLDQRNISSLLISQSSFIFDSPILYNPSQNIPSQSDNDFYQVFYSKGNQSPITITDSTFSQASTPQSANGSIPLNLTAGQNLSMAERIQALGNDPRVRIVNNIGLIMIDSAKSVVFARNTFSGNLFLNKAALQLVNTSSFTDTNSTYQMNAGYQGSSIYLDKGVKAFIYSSKFLSNYAEQGGGLYIQEGSHANLSGCSFTNNYARMHGGVIYVNPQTATASPVKPGGIISSSSNSGQANTIQLNLVTVILVLGSSFQDNYALQNGGIVSYSGAQDGMNRTSGNSSIELRNCNIKNSTGQKRGGVVFAQNLGAIIFKGVIISQVQSDQGKIVSTAAHPQNMSIELSESTFSCNELYLYEYIVSATQYNISKDASAFHLLANSSVKSKNNKYLNCFDALAGGVFQMMASRLKDENSQFYNNSALQGGVFRCGQGCNITLNNSLIQSNIASSGGVAQIEQNSGFFGTGLKFQENLAVLEGGALNLLQNANVNLSKIQFLSNQASSASVINLAGNKQAHFVTLSDILFYKNNANRNTIQIMNSGGHIKFAHCFFQYNEAKQYSKNIYVGSTKTVSISNTSFYDIAQAQRQNTTITVNKGNSIFPKPNVPQSPNVSPIITSPSPSSTDKQQGTFIYVSEVDSLSVEDSLFVNGTAENGGAVYVQGQSNVTMKSVTFEENVATESGGAVFVKGVKASVRISGKSSFKNNKASKGQGGDIYMASIIEYISLSLENTTINNANSAQNSIHLEGVSVNLTNVAIERSYAKSNTSGGAISCSDCPSFQMVNSSVKNSQAESGGAIYLVGIGNGTGEILQQSLISNSTFFNNKALQDSGGALSISNVANLTLQNNTFTYNTASEQGGALFTSCNTLDCNFTIDKSNVFISNQAGQSGGAIQWQNVAPVLPTNVAKSSALLKLMFRGNSAFYGPNIAGQPSELSPLTEQDVYDIIAINYGTNKGKGLRNLQAVSQSTVPEIQGTTQTNEVGLGTGERAIPIPTLYFALRDIYGQVVLTDTTTEVHIQTFDDSLVIQPKSKQFKPMVGGIYKIEGLKVSNIEIGKKYEFRVTTKSQQVIGYQKLTQTGQPEISSFMTLGVDKQTSTEVIVESNNVIKESPNAEKIPNQECMCGYSGPSCNECAVGYEQTVSKTCLKCPSTFQNLAILSSFALLAVAFAIYRQLADPQTTTIFIADFITFVVCIGTLSNVLHSLDLNIWSLHCVQVTHILSLNDILLVFLTLVICLSQLQSERLWKSVSVIQQVSASIVDFDGSLIIGTIVIGVQVAVSGVQWYKRTQKMEIIQRFLALIYILVANNLARIEPAYHDPIICVTALTACCLLQVSQSDKQDATLQIIAQSLLLSAVVKTKATAMVHTSWGLRLIQIAWIFAIITFYLLRLAYKHCNQRRTIQIKSSSQVEEGISSTRSMMQVNRDSVVLDEDCYNSHQQQLGDQNLSATGQKFMDSLSGLRAENPSDSPSRQDKGHAHNAYQSNESQANIAEDRQCMMDALSVIPRRFSFNSGEKGRKDSMSVEKAQTNYQSQRQQQMTKTHREPHSRQKGQVSQVNKV
ncbi:hypothetical protein FGO68_gene9945 [Halteria grandinella]|uniref:Uncharacterized protein n=1 Tax=Halteria grandinella TaxID=5974 RepID=A0A8J8TBA8_HALGN|nr:hypothetical protein FGO68_gene9945 [Halteria grandinella]